MVSAFPSCYAGKQSATWARSWRLKSSKRLSWSSKNQSLQRRAFMQPVPGGETQGLPELSWKVLDSKPGKSGFPLERGGLAVYCKAQPFCPSRHHRHAPLSKSCGDCILPLQMGSNTVVSPISNGMWVEDANSLWSESCHHGHFIAAFLFSFVLLVVHSAKCGFLFFLKLFFFPLKVKQADLSFHCNKLIPCILIN